MRFGRAASFAAIFIASSIWLVLQARTAEALVRWKKIPGTLKVGRNGLFQGDIVLPPQAKIALSLPYKLWENGIVPYVIEPELTLQKELIRSAMDEIENKSCLQFVPRTEERNYIKFVSGNECSSQLGCVGGPQKLTLGYGCMYIGIVLHELMHAAGFIHEHSRSDRDEYLNVFLENTLPGSNYDIQKLKPNENELLSPFDYDSIMLYDSESFTRETGLYTILTKDNKTIPHPADKPGLSPKDAQGLRVAYGCPEDCK